MLKEVCYTTYFLDNSINERQFGYQLITPFVYGNNTILVLRGWVKGSVNRSILPNVKTSYDEKKITGYLNEPPYSGISGMFDKSTIEVFAKDKIRIQKLDRIRLENVLDRKLDSRVFYLHSDEPDAYLVKNDKFTKQHKHFAYATQWFCMALVLLVIGVINIWKKALLDQNKPSKHKRLMLTFLVAIFVLPIIIAKVLIDTGMARDLATEQYGIIIEPAVDLNARESLKPLTKNGLAPSEWISFYFELGGCQEECQMKYLLYRMSRKYLVKTVTD